VSIGGVVAVAVDDRLDVRAGGIGNLGRLPRRNVASTPPSIRCPQPWDNSVGINQQFDAP
jgi:hypothetical protein